MSWTNQRVGRSLQFLRRSAERKKRPRKPSKEKVRKRKMMRMNTIQKGTHTRRFRECCAPAKVHPRVHRWEASRIVQNAESNLQLYVAFRFPLHCSLIRV